MTESLREAVDCQISDQTLSLSAQEMTRYIKDLAVFYGAKDIGVTPLQPYHVYSHIGRGTGDYGETLPVEHAYAIVFTVEMDFEMVGTSPYLPTSMETGKQYVEAARVAVQLAAAIRFLGYPARAHIDGNYRVIAPLVARDAGLGEIGRMTLLMTPMEGPRVRLGVVTTDLALIPDARKPDQAVIDFCTICEKCARVCPSRSIPFGPREEVDGALRWKLNPDTCFRYWAVVGTDCARCMSVCPYSHPDSFSHNLIRWGIARSGAFRRFALMMDDLFYGKKPRPKLGPGWVDH
jgi:ferredoxin